jgi:hypothetical protein
MAFIGLFVSFGKNLSVLYDLMFYYMPLFNKFRAPSMILALLQFAVPVLAGYGLFSIVGDVKNMTETSKKRILYIAIGCTAWLLIGFIMQGVNKDSYVASVEESVKAGHSELPGEFVFNMAMGDWERCAFLAAIFFFGAYMFVRGKIKAGVVLAAAILLTVIDLLWIDARRMEIVPKQEVKSEFQMTDVTDFLLKDKSLYRIYDITQAPNMPSYWELQHIVGYHAAKMREYQDLLDVAGVGSNGSLSQEFVNASMRANSNSGGPIANPFLWNLLNVKYIVSPGPLGPAYKPAFVGTVDGRRAFVFENQTILPRAFFVKGYEVKPALTILGAMKQGSFDPRAVEYFEEDPKFSVQPPDSTALVTVDSFAPQHIMLTANASGNNLLFLSEVYYKPCWKAYIDGQEVPILKADYLFRSILVPKGTHKIEFRYESKAFEQGKTVSLALNIFIVIAVVGLGGLTIAGKKKSEESQS